MNQETAAMIGEEYGANVEESKALLQRAMTVKDLKKVLENLDDSLLVEVEVVVEMNSEGECSSQPGLIVHHFQVRKEEEGFSRLTLVGAQPQNAMAYVEAFELDPKLQ